MIRPTEPQDSALQVYSAIMQMRDIVLGGTLCALVAGAGLTALWAQPAERVNGRTALGLVLRQINSTGTFMMATAHPDDENNGVLALLSKGEGIRTTLVTATRGDGGAERDRVRALRCVGGAAHRGVAGGPSPRRGGTVFHPCRRLRVFLQPGRDVPEVGPRGDPGRLRADDSDHPARRHRGDES